MAIDLNSDLGEGVGEDPEKLDNDLLAVVTSANVACGGHAGTPESMARVCLIAAERRVAVGAHISYEDRAGFGRNPNAATGSVLKEQLLRQMLVLESYAEAAGTGVTYVKPHGELYHASVLDGRVARTIVEAVQEFGHEIDRRIKVLCFPGSELMAIAESEGVPAVGEAFADRAYSPAGTLVPRGEPGAVITDPAEAVGRLKRLVRDNEIYAIDGSSISVKAGSICIHGDTPGAVRVALRLKAAIDADRVRVLPFAPPPA